MRCMVPGCQREATRRWGRPLCDTHHAQRRRSGSPWGEPILVKDLDKHRVAALHLMDKLDPDRKEEGCDDPWLTHAYRVVKHKLQTSRGKSIVAVKGKPPRVQADAWWARAREDGVSARNIIAAGLSIARMAARGENSMLRKRQFYETQLGRVLHRKAHSTHVADLSTVSKVDGMWVERKCSKRYWARTSGRSLRMIGRDVAEAVELVVEHKLRV